MKCGTEISPTETRKETKMTVTINRPEPATDATTDGPNGAEAITVSPRPNGTAGVVWDALTANPGATTMAIANAAGVSRTSAAKALNAMEAAGQAVRTPGDGAGRSKTPDTWTVAPATEDTVDNVEELRSAVSEDSADDTTLTADEPGRTPAEDAVATAEPGTGTTAGGGGPGSAVQDAVKILEAEAERRAKGEAEIRKAQADEEARRQKIDADLRRARTKEETRRALADLLAAVTTTYAAVISDDDDVVTAGLERINAEMAAVRRAAKATAPRFVTPRAAGGDRSAPRPLRPLVEAHLTAYAGKEFTAGEIAKVLDRSPGAVANALDTLVGQGVVELTCEHPRRFRASDPGADE
jgi:hypothetical protein